MTIEPLKAKHIQECAALLMQAYNGAPWENHWTLDTAERYLNEFLVNPRFVGFVIYERERLVGATFCHEKTWWIADELFVDEFYVSPEYQHKGYGTALEQHLEKHAKDKKLGGLTLLTDHYMPALNFYKKIGFAHSEHVVFMYKQVERGAEQV